MQVDHEPLHAGPPLALRLLDRMSRLEEVLGLTVGRCDVLEKQV